jgi:tRNA(fMet)-specific endonuclease VapC
MAPRYLLDTNVLSDLIKSPQGEAAQRIASAGEGSVCTSIVVAAELRNGAEKKDSSKLAERVELLLSAVEVLPLEAPADRHYGQIRNYLEKQGTPTDPNDLLIAAQARALELTLVTANTQEFSRVPNLRMENWLNTKDV